MKHRNETHSLNKYEPIKVWVSVDLQYSKVICLSIRLKNTLVYEKCFECGFDEK